MLNVLSAMRDDTLVISRVFSPSHPGNEVCMKAFNMIISKSDRRKFFVSGADFEYLLEVEDEHFELFNLGYIMQGTFGPKNRPDPRPFDEA